MIIRIGQRSYLPYLIIQDYIGEYVLRDVQNYTRKQLDELTEFVKRPQIGAKGLIYLKYNTDGTLKSSVDKFYSREDLKKWLIL